MPGDRRELEAQYQARLPLYERLRDEVIFSLDQGLQERRIKTHGVSSRIKQLRSLQDKAERKGYTRPLEEAQDIVGTRVVTLFLSDLPRVQEVIDTRFRVMGTEDKIEGADPSSFGYMSMHYVATLNERHSGPRYDDIKSMPFEIQVRTIVMDAWANVSHYLAYKGEASIPSHLRRDFYALSGLFYVADQHFELFFTGAMESREAAERDLQAGERAGVEVNLETVLALLHRKYPDRKHSSPESVSQFVEEVTSVGYTDLLKLDEALSKADPVLDEYEELDPPAEEYGAYADLGLARGALAIVDPNYRAFMYSVEGVYEDLRKRLTEGSS